HRPLPRHEGRKAARLHQARGEPLPADEQRRPAGADAGERRAGAAVARIAGRRPHPARQRGPALPAEGGPEERSEISDQRSGKIAPPHGPATLTPDVTARTPDL